MNISKKLNLGINSHSEIEFVDIKLETDIKLFLDPCLIDICDESYGEEARNTISSYFDKFFKLYAKNSDDAEKLKLFEHSHEINATKLGYGNGDNGKAKTAEGMLKTFRGVTPLIRNFKMNHPIDLAVFIKDYSEDCLSDTLTNILFKVLSDFTIKQCKKYGIDTIKAKKDYYFWEPKIGDWAKYQGNSLIIDGEDFLLVPKIFVRSSFYYNTSQYFSRIILEKIQDENEWIDSDGKTQRPTKKSLRKGIVFHNKDVLMSAIEQTNKQPDLLDLYHQLIPGAYSNKAMSDEGLDKITYGI